MNDQVEKVASQQLKRERGRRLVLLKLARDNRAMLGFFAGALCASAPPGHYWSADPGVHELVADLEDGRAAAERDLIERMKLGVEKCTAADCNWCQREGEPYPEMERLLYDPRKEKYNG